MVNEALVHPPVPLVPPTSSRVGRAFAAPEATGTGCSGTPSYMRCEHGKRAPRLLTRLQRRPLKNKMHTSGAASGLSQA